MVIVSDILLPKNADGILKVSDVSTSADSDLSARTDIADPTTSTFVKTDATGRLNILESNIEGAGVDNSLNSTEFAVSQMGAFDGSAYRVSNVGRLEVDINSGGGGGDASAANQTNGNQKTQIFGIDEDSSSQVQLVVKNSGRLQCQIVGSNDINGGAPFRHLTIDANGRTLTNPLMTATNTAIGTTNTLLSAGLPLPSKTELDVFTLAERTVPIGSVTSTNTLELKGTGKVCITIHSDTTNHSAILRLSNDGTNFFSPSVGGSFNPSGTGFLLVAEFDNVAKLVQVEYINTSGGIAVISQAKLVY